MPLAKKSFALCSPLQPGCWACNDCQGTAHCQSPIVSSQVEYEGGGWSTEAEWFFRAHWHHLLFVQRRKLRPTEERGLVPSHGPWMLNFNLILHHMLFLVLHVVRSPFLIWKTEDGLWPSRLIFIQPTQKKTEGFSMSLAWIQRDPGPWGMGIFPLTVFPYSRLCSFSINVRSVNPHFCLSPVMWISQEHRPETGWHRGFH